MIQWKNIHWLWLSLLIIIIDQATKILIQHTVLLNTAINVTSYFNIVHLHNYGAAFSFMDTPGGMQRWLFSLFSLIISLVLVGWLLTIRQSKKLECTALSFIIGGALGNLWDRFTVGYVVDFLDFHLKHYHWPAFNVADSAVCVGAVLLIIAMMGSKDRA